MSSVKVFFSSENTFLCNLRHLSLGLNCYIIILVIILMPAELSIHSRFAYPNSFPLLPHLKVFTFLCMAVCFWGDWLSSQPWGQFSFV